MTSEFFFKFKLFSAIVRASVPLAQEIAYFELQSIEIFKELGYEYKNGYEKLY